jgi:CheY-like chemotaxis protein
MILGALLRRQGHEVLLAEDGHEAVQCFRDGHPDIVLMDVIMPGLDGIEAARRIRALAGDELIPLIFLTSLNQVRDLEFCIEAGGDDFLNKPYNPVVLQAKIKAFARLRRLHQEVSAQREHLLAEQRAAKEVFDRIARQGALDAPNIRYLMSPMAIFNGDVLLAARQPGGDLIVFLGDFTGHGLPAAIGIMPLTEIFHGMVGRGFGLQAVLREINARLKAVLPAGTFCCATAVQLGARHREAVVWNGGLPEGVVFHRGSRRLSRLPSTHLPLGILATEAFRFQPVVLDLQPDDALYLWSDGVIETENGAGEMFGDARLQEVFLGVADPAGVFDEITLRLRAFGRQHDDYSLVEIRPCETLAHDAPTPVPAQAVPESVGTWSMEIELRADSLRQADPVPVLMQMLLQARGLQQHGGVVNTILTELYTNALEHGVLGLPSALKADGDGFHHYYRQRAERLRCLEEGSVRIRAEVLPAPAGGLLRLSMKDSGAGFDYRAPGPAGEYPPYYGRGLRLLASLCRRVEYLPPGNEVVVEFAWQVQGGGHV